jgi:WD40 repeat protein
VWDILNRKALSPVLQFSRTDYPSGKLFEPGETPGPEFAVDFAPDGRRLVTTAWDGTVRIWDLTEVVTQSLSLPKPLATLAVLPKSADPVTIKREQDGVQVKELASSRQTRFEIARPQPNTDGPAQEQFQYRYSDDGKWLAVANTSILTPGWLVVIDTASFKPRRLQTEHPGSIRDFVFGPRGQRLFVIFGSDYFHQRRATSQKDVAPGYVRAWDPHTGQPMTPAFAESRRVSAIQFDRDGERLIGSWDKGVRVWNTRTGKTVSPVMRQQAVITAIVVSPDGRTIAIGNSDNTARLWNADSGETMTPPFRHGPALKSFIPPSVMVALSADANLLATAGSDRMVRIWNSQTAQPMGPKLSIGFVPTDIRFDPDQNSLYVSGKGGAEHSFDIAPMGGKLDELALLAQKLSMREFDKTDVLVYQTNQQMEDQVKRVKALPALGMVPTSEQILNWHKSRLAANPSDPVSIRFHREQILLIEPDEPDWYLQRAADRLWSNQTKQAIADYTKALELGAEGFQPWVGLAVAHVMNQALPEAAKAFTSAIERGDGSDATLLTQLLVQLAIGDVQGYRDTEARLIRSAPQHGTGSLMREQIMRAMAIRIYAGQDCHHALAFIQAKGGKATVYGAADAYCRKDFETARTYLKEQIHKKIHNQPAAEAFMLSMVNQRLGDERAAKGWFTRGIRWHTEWSNTQRLKRDSLSGFLTQLNPALMAAPLLELTVLRNSAAALIGREKADSTD